MRRTRRVIGLLLLPTILFAKEAPLTDKVWVIIRPVQCLGNPWEKDWLATHKNQEAKYPRKQEAAVLKKYFAKKKITVVDIRQKPYTGQGVCMSCDCSRGDILYVKIHVSHVPQMVDMGYTERLPAAEDPTHTNP